MCFTHYFAGCHDWVFESTGIFMLFKCIIYYLLCARVNFCIAYGFLNHASDTNIHGAMLMVSGDPTPLNPKYHDLYKWFVAGIPRKHYNIDLSQWRQKKLSGLVLTTTEMIEWQWEEKLKPAMIAQQEKDAENGNLNK